jgi:AraC-like DNA-binding protein
MKSYRVHAAEPLALRTSTSSIDRDAAAELISTDDAAMTDRRCARSRAKRSSRRSPADLQTPFKPLPAEYTNWHFARKNEQASAHCTSFQSLNNILDILFTRMFAQLYLIQTPAEALSSTEFEHDRIHVNGRNCNTVYDVPSNIALQLRTAGRSGMEMPIGELLSCYIVALEQCPLALVPADFPRLTDAVRKVIAAAAVTPSAEQVAAAKRQIGRGRKERVRQVIREHLRSPTLRPSTLCRLVGMSRSNLYRLLEGSGGIARYIQMQRLLEAHAILSNPTTTGSISTIAEDLCFADASTFSRSFRREFGLSPSDLRSASLATLGHPV